MSALLGKGFGGIGHLQTQPLARFPQGRMSLAMARGVLAVVLPMFVTGAAGVHHHADDTASGIPESERFGLLWAML